MIYKKNNKAPGTFSVIAKHVIEDKRLSAQERGILIYLLSKPSDWEVNIKDLIRQGLGGRSSVQKAMKSLVTFGYAELKRCKDPNNPGRFLGSRYHIYEDPKNREREILAAGKTDSRESREPRKSTTSKASCILKNEVLLKNNTIHKQTHTKASFQKFLEIYEVNESDSLYKIWEKIPVDDYDKILEHAAKYIPANSNKRYRKLAQNYLKQETWKQEIIDRNHEENTNNGRASGPTKSSNARSHSRAKLKKTGFKTC
ncbi:MAG: hypothetical protein AAFR87_34805 [Bacteroidota bacterium]